MAGKPGMKWDKDKKNGRFPCKKNTALTKEYNDKVENKANKDRISESAVIRQCVEKVL